MLVEHLFCACLKTISVVNSSEQNGSEMRCFEILKYLTGISSLHSQF